MSTQSEANRQFILKTSCKAGSGIVAGVSSYLSAQGCYISELAQFDDQDSGQFFMRACFHFEDPADKDPKSLREGFAPVAEKFGMEWQMFDASAPTRTLIMVSKADHCLDDLLYRMHKGELNMEVTAVVSNHQDLRPMVEREGIRFIHLPVTKDNKPEQEKRLLELVDETKSDLVVLARYMQILSDDLCRQLVGRAINIHHSFLPGFKGARPYYQAYDRGVKLIGATAHYVTSDLDEGPIIEQSVQPVDHTFGPERLTAAGRDTETMALARAVKRHTEHRVFLDGNKTVVFK
ncbi:MAG: formyltetrahydrofolate deformylase [Oceanospirillaceae bacterium]|uniref:formyltetrahydrofolate deformylase n=1 Tax=unclassified Thalassolituus TaxID=2624967 RepID=UPI000C6359A4|nr:MULTISPECIES: formyltetrahydrofolate deformylase [unclassified Thalassolituus]MAS23816.1 formyltetrahydrofolate deformylase [Oceanospirillaceae bacterium]MAY00842.1 formyltetrahydrofolate deformylase [Oceanospirillaceae bacterium]MBL36664.1 formyltetrahydrofolate deformylase [Oceanospirillaceae bacterium]MBS54448.1 formyltetrahydrofolate deformylase [Oceanospirillaceae bacterium]|tara:strand:- start:1438 stop:2313 length:876 start_codon:yes stop_codon:yes gene_type:complete